MDNWINPSYGGGEEQPGVWFDFSIGEVDFFMLDCRFYRTPDVNTMLGPVQLQWLQDKLTDHGVEAELKVYEGAGHGWEKPQAQAFIPGLSVTKDCLMTWTKDGQNIEQSSDRSVDSTLGGPRPLRRA